LRPWPPPQGGPKPLVKNFFPRGGGGGGSNPARTFQPAASSLDRLSHLGSSHLANVLGADAVWKSCNAHGSKAYADTCHLRGHLSRGALAPVVVFTASEPSNGVPFPKAPTSPTRYAQLAATINLLKPNGFFTYHQVQYSKILHGARFALSVCTDLRTNFCCIQH